jgi:thymidylate synthase (FAD)
MEINLIEISGIKAIEKAAAMPFQTNTIDYSGLAYRVWKSQHRSICRHGVISLEVKDISQDALRQLSRHPHINLTVKSTRYCDMSDTNNFIPKWVTSGLKEKYETDFCKIRNMYEKWQRIEMLESEEDTAKLFLPLMSTTDLVLSGNIQAMYEFLMLRNCERASEEIRTMSRIITKMLSEEAGLVGMIFRELDCKGKEYGKCPEHKGCGKFE